MLFWSAEPEGLVLQPDQTENSEVTMKDCVMEVFLFSWVIPENVGLLWLIQVQDHCMGVRQVESKSFHWMCLSSCKRREFGHLMVMTANTVWSCCLSMNLVMVIHQWFFRLISCYHTCSICELPLMVISTCFCALSTECKTILLKPFICLCLVLKSVADYATQSQSAMWCTTH